MRRFALATTVSALVAFLGLGVALAQNAPSYDRGWSQMMMGPMAGCPMGAGNQGMMGPHMMGPGMMGQGMMGQGIMGQGMMGHMGGGQNANIDTQLDTLRATLAIRSNQQNEWNAYAAAARADSQSMFDMHNRMGTFMQGQPATAPQWLGAHRDMMRARADSLDALAGATERLYAALDASQKSTFDRYGGGMCGSW